MLLFDNFKKLNIVFVDKKGDSVKDENEYLETLKFVKLSKDAVIPKRATGGSAGLDLCACAGKSILLKPGERALIHTGIAISLPKSDFVALIFARSGLAIKHGITLSNGVGVIDSDYRGEICAGLCNMGKDPYTIKPNERIAQLVIIKVENFPPVEVKTLDSTERGTGGFGSTGKN